MHPIAPADFRHSMLQRGLLFTALDHHIKEIDVPAPPYDCNAILPSAYATFLPGAGAALAALQQHAGSSCEVT